MHDPLAAGAEEWGAATASAPGRAAEPPSGGLHSCAVVPPLREPPSTPASGPVPRMSGGQPHPSSLDVRTDRDTSLPSEELS